MKLNIKQKDCRFIVKPEERVVVCIIEGEWIEDAVHEFIRDLEDPSFDLCVYGKFARQIDMPKSFIGKAVCAPTDEWNEEVGKLVAFYRAKNKFYNSFFKRGTMYINRIDRAIDKIYDAFNDMGEALDLNKLKLEQHIKELGGEDILTLPEPVEEE